MNQGYQRWNIFRMINSEEGHEMLVRKMRCHLKHLPWGSIDHMIRELKDNNDIFVPCFSTIYEVKPDGKS